MGTVKYTRRRLITLLGTKLVNFYKQTLKDKRRHIKKDQIFTPAKAEGTPRLGILWEGIL